jgi:hypothetical protein
MTWAIGNILKIIRDYTNKGIDWVANKQRYNVEITLQGAILESRSGLTAPQIISLLDTMSNFGSLEIHITSSGGNNDEGNIHSDSFEGSSERTETD